MHTYLRAFCILYTHICIQVVYIIHMQCYHTYNTHINIRIQYTACCVVVLFTTVFQSEFQLKNIHVTCFLLYTDINSMKQSKIVSAFASRSHNLDAINLIFKKGRVILCLDINKENRRKRHKREWVYTAYSCFEAPKIVVDHPAVRYAIYVPPSCLNYILICFYLTLIFSAMKIKP